LPVLPALRGLLPGLRRGQVVSVDEVGALATALVAGASENGAWCAVVGLPECGVLAAARSGVSLDRLMLVDEPGERWAEVVAILLGAVEVVMLRPPARLSVTEVRRLSAFARRHGAVLVVAGVPWEGAQVRLRVASSVRTGLGDGHGHLRGRQPRRPSVASRGSICVAPHRLRASGAARARNLSRRRGAERRVRGPARRMAQYGTGEAGRAAAQRTCKRGRRRGSIRSAAASDR
jgi:hypothetical protein